MDNSDDVGRLMIAEPWKTSSADPNCSDVDGQSTPLQAGQPIISSATPQPPPKQQCAVQACSIVQDGKITCPNAKEGTRSLKGRPGKYSKNEASPLDEESDIWKEYPRKIRLPIMKSPLELDSRKQLTLTYARATNGQQMVRCENCNFQRAPSNFHEHLIMHLFMQPFRCPEKGCDAMGFADDGAIVEHYANCHTDFQPRKTFAKTAVTMADRKIGYLSRRCGKVGCFKWTHELANPQIYTTDTRTSRAWRLTDCIYVEMEQPAEDGSGLADESRLEVPPSCRQSADPKANELLAFSGVCKEHVEQPLKEGLPATGHESRKPKPKFQILKVTEHDGMKSTVKEVLLKDGSAVMRYISRNRPIESQKPSVSTSKRNSQDQEERPQSTKALHTLEESYPQTANAAAGGGSGRSQGTVGVENGKSATAEGFGSGAVERVRSGHGSDDVHEVSLLMEVFEEDMTCSPYQQKSQETQVEIKATLKDVTCRVGFFPEDSLDWVKISPPEPENSCKKPAFMVRGLSAPVEDVEPRKNALATSPVMASTLPVIPGLVSPIMPTSKPSDLPLSATWTYGRRRSQRDVLPSPPGHPHTAAAAQTSISAIDPKSPASGSSSTLTAYSSSSGDESAQKAVEGQAPLTVSISSSPAPRTATLKSSTVPPLPSTSTGSSTAVPSSSSSSSASQDSPSGEDGGNGKGDAGGGDRHCRSKGNKMPEAIAGQLVHLLCNLNYPPTFTLNCISLEDAHQMYQTALQRNAGRGGYQISILITLQFVRCVDCCCKLNGMDHMVRHLWRHSHVGGIPCRFCENVQRPAGQCIHIVKMVSDVRNNLRERKIKGTLNLLAVQPEVFPVRPSPSILEHVDSDLAICQEPIELVTIDDENEDDVCLVAEKPVVVKEEPVSDEDSTPSQSRQAAEQHPARPADQSLVSRQCQGEMLPPPPSHPHAAAVAQPSTSGIQPIVALPPPPSHPHAAPVAQPSTSGIEPIVVETVSAGPGLDSSTAIDVDADARPGSQPSEDTVHLPNSQQPYYYQCNHCSLSFLQRWCLEVHLKTLHPMPQVPHYTCSLCLSKCMSVDILLLHLDSHMESTVDRVIPCLYRTCPEVFTSAPEYMQHQEKVHPERCSFVCVCGKVWNTAQDMSQHLFNKAIPVFQCGQCSARSCDLDLLVQHVRDAHSGNGGVTAKVIFICFLRKHQYDSNLISGGKEKLISRLSRQITLMCKTCSLVHPDKEAQEWHESCHAGKSVTSDVFVHQEGKPLPSENELSCPLCPEKFRSTLTFTQHLGCHMGEIVVNVYGCSVHKEFFTTHRDAFLQHVRNVGLSQSHSAFSEQQLYSARVMWSTSKVARCSEPGCSFLCLAKNTLAMHNMSHNPAQNPPIATRGMPGTSHAMPLMSHQGGFGQQSGTVANTVVGRPVYPLHQTSTAVSQQPLHQTSSAVSGFRTQQAIPSATATGPVSLQQPLHQTSSAVSHQSSNQTSSAVSHHPSRQTSGAVSLQPLHQTSSAVSHQSSNQTSSAVSHHPSGQSSSAVSLQPLHQTSSTVSQHHLPQAGACESQPQVHQQWVLPHGTTPSRTGNTGSNSIGASGSGTATSMTVSSSLPHQGLVQGATTVASAPRLVASMSADTAAPQLPTSSVVPSQQWFVVGSVLSQVQNRSGGVSVQGPSSAGTSGSAAAVYSLGTSSTGQLSGVAPVNVVAGHAGGNACLASRTLCSTKVSYSHQQGAQNVGMQRPQTVGAHAQQNMGVLRPQNTGGQRPQNAGMQPPLTGGVQRPQNWLNVPNRFSAVCSTPQHQPMHPNNLGVCTSLPQAVRQQLSNQLLSNQQLSNQQLPQQSNPRMANALPQGTSQQQQFSKPNPRMGHGLTQVPQAQNFQALNLPQQPQFVRFAVNGITAQLPYAGSVIHVVQPQAIAGTSLLQQLNTSVEAKQGPVSAPVPAGNLPTVVQELTVPGPSLASNNAAAASPIVMVSSAPHVQQTTVAFPSSTSTPITRSVLVGKDLANPNGSSLHHGSGHPSALSFTAPAPPRSLEPPIVKRAMGKDNDTTQRSGTILSGNASALPLLTSYLTTPETASNSRRKQHLEMRRVEDATMEVVEKMDVNAESELSIKVLDACSIPLQIFDRMGDPNTEAGIDPGWNEEQIRPMEEPTDVGGTTGTAVHQWPPLAEKHGCGPCVVNLCDVRGMVPTTGTVTVTNYLLRMLRKRKCCSSSARSDDSSGMENDDEILPSVQHSLRKKRRIFPELESEDEVISTFFDFAGEAGIEPYEGEDMDFDTLEKAAVHVREETILLDRDQAGGLGMVTMMENGTLSSRETTGTHAKTKEGESQPRKPKTVHQPVSISGGSGEKKRGRPQRVSQTPSPVNKEVIHAEATAPSRERDAPAGGSVREGPQKKSDDTDVDLPKALCLVCNITFIGLDVATDVMTHLRDCHLTKFTYNRCPYCMAVSNKLEDVEAHVEACHPDCCLAVVTHEFPQSLGSRMVPLSPTCLNQEVPAQACAPGPSEGKGLDKDWYKDTIDKCLICQETLEEDNTLPAVRNHMKDVHLLTSMYKCGHCLAVSDSPQNIAWHSKICHQNIWVINHGILNHVEQEQPPPMAKDVSLAKPSLQGELNTCLLCKEKFDDEDIQKMAEHMVRRHKNTMVKCGHCNCISGSKADIINHCKNCHGTIKLAVYPHLESQSLERAGRRAVTHGASSSQQRQEGKMSRERSTPPEQDKKADCWRFICTKCGMCYTDRNIFSDHTQSCFNVEPYSYVCPRAACSTVRRSFAHPEDYYRHAKDLHGSTTEPSLVKNRLEVRRLDSLVSSGENLAEQLQVPNPEGLVQSVSRIYLGLAGPDSNEEFEVPESLPAGPAATKKEKASSSVASDDTRMLSPSLSDAFTVSSSESDVVEICSVYSSPSYRPGSHLGRTWRRSDNVKFVCNQCDATMSSLPVYERHLAKHSIFHCFRKVCDWCGYVAEDIRSLVRHRKLEHPTEMYSCERCSYKCPNPRDMKEHYKRTHNEFHWGPLGRKAINMQPSVLLLNFLSIPPHLLGHFMSANDVGAIDCMGSGLALPSQEPFCEDEEILQLLKEEGAEEKNV